MSELIDACVENRQKDVASLVQADGDSVNAFDSRGLSPLIAAARYGHYRLVKLLIRLGAAVDLANPETGRTALHHSAKEGHADVAKLLIKKYGADVKKRDVAGRTCLHWACVGGNIDVVKILLLHKAPFDTRDASGYTPFMTAVEFERTEAANLLLKRGAGAKSQNNLKHNALEIADWYGHKPLVETLSKVYNSADGDATASGGAGAGAGAAAAAAAPAPAEGTAAPASAGGDPANAATSDVAMQGRPAKT